MEDIRGITSLSLGAEELSEQVRLLEEAVKEDNWSYVQEQHETFMMMYHEVLSSIEKAIE